MCGHASDGAPTVCTPGQQPDGNGGCQNCNVAAGFWSNGNDQCASIGCVAGQEADGSGGCTDCPAGQYNTEVGPCGNCPANTFSANTGSTSCTPCAGGDTSDPGSSACISVCDSTYQITVADSDPSASSSVQVSYRSDSSDTVATGNNQKLFFVGRY